jgi:hypothetical protein
MASSKYVVEVVIETSATSNSDAVSRVETALQNALPRGGFDVKPYIVRVRNCEEK